MKNKLWFVSDIEVDVVIRLKEEFYECSYCKYLFDKVTKASNKYGLLFFNDTEVVNSIKEQMGIKEELISFT